MPTVVTLNTGSNVSRFHVRESVARIEALLKIAAANSYPAVRLTADGGASVLVSVRCLVAALEQV